MSKEIQTIYPNLDFVMKRRRTKLYHLAAALNKSANYVRRRTLGQADFTLREMQSIANFFWRNR